MIERLKIMKKQERIACAIEYDRRQIGYERKEKVKVMGEYIGFLKCKNIEISAAERILIESIAMRLIYDHDRFIIRQEFPDGTARVSLNIVVNTNEDVLPEEKAKDGEGEE